MKRITIMVLTLFALAVVAAAAAPAYAQETAPAKSIEQTKTPKANEYTCPQCGAAHTSKDFTLEQGGKTMHFCCQECKDKYMKSHPKKGTKGGEAKKETPPSEVVKTK
jgi:hypothetical protein